MDDRELEALAAELRADDPRLSLEQSLDAAAVMLAELGADLADWDARRDSMIATLENYSIDWDRMCGAAKSGRGGAHGL